jgi:DNA-binding MarR family transcriptional regulator
MPLENIVLESNTLPYRQYRLFHDIYILFDAGDRNVLREFNLTNSQYRVLVLLNAEYGQRLMTLSERMLCARSTITRLIDQMEAAQLVHRITDPEDRRAQRVALTPLGVEVRARAMAAHEVSLTQRFGFLSEADQRQFLSLLEKMRSNLQTQINIASSDSRERG